MTGDLTQLTAREAAEALWLAAHQAGLTARTGGRRSEPERPGKPTTGEAGDRVAEDYGSPAPDDRMFEPRGADGPETRSAAPRPARMGSSPLGPALLDEREISRALRPFNTGVISHANVELDEEATAEQACEDGLWLPVVRAGKARSFTVVLLVDDSLSMLVWRRTVDAFADLLEHQGAFSNVLSYYFDTDDTSAPDLALRSGVAGAAARSPSELIQPRRVVLVLTDGVGSAWRSGKSDRFLAALAARLPLAVVHLLPRQTWHRTALSPYVVNVRSSAPAAVNADLEWQLTPGDFYADVPATSGRVPIPLLALDADSLGWWARLVADGSPTWSDAEAIFAGAATNAADEVVGISSPGRKTPMERVLRFRSTSTPTAFELATYLAAAPLRLPLMQLVQQAMLPGSGPAHLSEVLTSGLVHRVGEDQGLAKEETLFDFDEGVREQLLSAGFRRDTARVLRLVGDHLPVEVSRQINDVLAAPDTAPDPPVTPETMPLIKLQNTVLRALSGPYLAPAKRFTGMLNRLPDALSLPAHHGTKDADMSEAEESPAPPRVMAASEGHQPATTYSDFEPSAGKQAHRSPTERRPGDPPLVWGNVPPRNPNFTGRELLLEDLHHRLQTGVAAVLPEALHGMGGVGKSQIAVEYIYRHTADYDLIWWIPSDGTTQIASALVELAQQTGAATSDEPVIAVPAVLEALRTGRLYRNWLLVFDNAESPDVVRTYFPADGPGHILVTSRNPQWASIARPLEVDVFEREESKQLLHRRGPSLSDRDADRLADALGDLPLAIEQAAAWLAETGMPADEYLRLFEEKASELLGAVEITDYQLSVAAAWNVSLDRLREGHPAALQLLQVCAFFAPEPISRQLLSGVRDAPVPPELLASLRDPIRLGRAIREINRYALARIDHRNNTLQLHRLVQAVLIGQMSPVQRQEMRHAAHVLLASGDPNDPDSATQWARYRQLVPHVQASGAVDCEDAWVRNLVLNTIRFLYQWGDHEAYRDLAQRTVDDWQVRLGVDDEQTLSASQWLGRSLRLLAHYERARKLNDSTLTRMRQVLGEDHEDTNLMMNSVAADMRFQGDFYASRDLNRQAAEIAERVFGEDDPATLIARHNLGVSTRLCGGFVEALEMDKVTQDREIQVLGEQNRITLNTLNGIGLDELESGHYLAARNRQESTMMRCRRVLGDDSSLTILVIQTLAVARRRAGDHAGAFEMAEEALARFRGRYGKNDPQSILAAAELAINLRHTGDLEGAKSLGARTLERFRRTLGERHPHTLAAAIAHAVVLRLLGDARAAHQLDEAAWAQLRDTLGAEHPLTLTCATNLASDLAALGEPQAAHDLGAETLERSKRLPGAEHPSTLVCAANLGLDLRTLNRTEEAEALRNDAFEKLRLVLGDNHPAIQDFVRGIRANCDANPLPL